MNRETYDMLSQVESLGVTSHDSLALRRISMTLHRWHELECGDGNDYCSWAIARGHRSNGRFEYDDNGKSYLETHYHDGKATTYSPIPDRERGALKRLAKIMAQYPALTAYVQGDPRGASLYILRPSDVPEGQVADSYYNRGVAVYK